jgi:hypothetical protein
MPRRFPPPWSIEELNDACFIVRDSNGQQLAYVYYEEEPQRRVAGRNDGRQPFATKTAPETCPGALSAAVGSAAGRWLRVARSSHKKDNNEGCSSH